MPHGLSLKRGQMSSDCTHQIPPQQQHLMCFACVNISEYDWYLFLQKVLWENMLISSFSSLFSSLSSFPSLPCSSVFICMGRESSFLSPPLPSVFILFLFAYYSIL
jgi:hypothetical protein